MGRTGPVMAFVHPNPMDQSCWIYQMARFSTWFRCAAIDAEGRPTRDPAAALAGSILAFGGYKGSGLALMVQALGLLGGAALTRGQVQDFAFLFVVFAPDLLMPAAEFKHQVSELCQRVRETPTQPGVDTIRIPSERAFREREARRRTGISLPRPIYDRLNAL